MNFKPISCDFIGLPLLFVHIVEVDENTPFVFIVNFSDRQNTLVIEAGRRECCDLLNRVCLGKELKVVCFDVSDNDLLAHGVCNLDWI